MERQRTPSLLSLLKVLLRNSIRLRALKSLAIGSKCRIRKNSFDISGRDNRLVFEEGANIKGCHIEIDGRELLVSIGKHSVIGENCYFSCREAGVKLVIGDHCMFSRNIKLMTSDGHDISQEGRRINPAADIVIGDHVWLADGVTILKGVTVGDNAVVGLHSVVTKDVPANSIVVGNPARVVKENITWDERLTF